MSDERSNDALDSNIHGAEIGFADDRVSGAELDANAVNEHDGRSDAPTGFNSNEKYLADSSQDHGGVDNPAIRRDGEYIKKWEWLNKLNDGHRTDGWKGLSNEANQQRFADIVMGELNCTDYQRERVSDVLKSQDGRSHGGKHYEVVVMAIISLVLEEDGRYVRDEDEWIEFRDDLTVDGTDVEKHDIKSVRFSLEDKDLFMSENQSTKSLQ